jgi:hypothetical protein
MQITATIARARHNEAMTRARRRRSASSNATARRYRHRGCGTTSAPHADEGRRRVQRARRTERCREVQRSESIPNNRETISRNSNETRFDFSRRQVELVAGVWINVTKNPTAEWVARQITEAFPWDGAPGYMIRDRDRIYGAVVTRLLRAMGIRDKLVAPASPWQNGFAERLIGSIRRTFAVFGFARCGG